MNTFELAVKTRNLPTKIEELVPLSFIGNEAVKFYKSKLNLCDNLNLSEEQRKTTLKDGQDAGIMLLEIEGRIGELSKGIEGQETKAIQGPDGEFKGRSVGKGKHKYEKLGLRGKYQLERKQMIANYPKIKEEVIKEAIANDDIPTPTAVVSRIMQKNAEKRVRELEDKAIEKKVKEHPKAVKEYFDAISQFKTSLNFAIENAKRDKFSPESIHLIKTKHGELINLMKVLEEKI